MVLGRASCCGSGAVSEPRFCCCAITFPSPLTLAWPWAWAPGWAGGFSDPHSTPRLTGRAWEAAVLFHTFSTTQLCFFTLVTARPGGGGWEVAGAGPHRTVAAYIRLRSFPHCLGFSLCLLPVISIPMGPRWPEPLLQLLREACARHGCGGSAHQGNIPPASGPATPLRGVSIARPRGLGACLHCDSVGFAREFGSH